MLKFLKWVKVGFWGAVIGISLCVLAVISTLHNNTRPPWAEITHADNVSRTIPTPHQRAIKKSRLSAVLIQSSPLSFWGDPSTTSGTYFMVSDRHYVITVQHGIVGPCWLIRVEHDGHHTPCKEYIIVDKERDYVIMEIGEPLLNRRPIQIPQDLPHGGQWKSSYALLTNIIYTGYPNTRGPLTLRGDVVGYGDDESLYIFSHAYGGASGSGVFTAEGKYIGYIVAIDVGETEWGIDVLENIVIVAPTFNVDWSHVLN
jgi:hypothetical protein